MSELIQAAASVQRDRAMMLGNGELEKCGKWEVEGKSGHSAAIMVKGSTIKVAVTPEQSAAYEKFVGQQVAFVGVPKGGEKGAMRITTLIDLAPLKPATSKPAREAA